MYRFPNRSCVSDRLVIELYLAGLGRNTEDHVRGRIQSTNPTTAPAFCRPVGSQPARVAASSHAYRRESPIQRIILPELPAYCRPIRPQPTRALIAAKVPSGGSGSIAGNELMANSTPQHSADPSDLNPHV